MSKIVIFIDHDIIVRHFILNHAFAAVEKVHDVVYVFPENYPKRVKSDPSRLNLTRFRKIPIDIDRFMLYRRLNHTTVLHRLRYTPDWKFVFMFWRDILGRREFWRARLCSLPWTYPFYRRYQLMRIGANPVLDALLEEEKPDIVMHPSVLEGLFVSDLVSWNKKTKVPVIFLMNSWDNPAQKAMMVGHPTRLTVWGEQTRQHAIRNMRMPAEDIRILGAAQFEVYRRPPKISSEDYRRSLGFSKQDKILLYAGSSKGLNETHHLQVLDEAIERGELPRCKVLFRPHPWRAYPENEKDFFSITFRHVIMAPDMIECYKNYRGGNKMLVELADYENTHTTLSAVDAVISPLSTILLEAALHGKPSAAYLPDEDMKSNKWLFTFANMKQFTEFFTQVDCIKCEHPEDLVRDCARLLAKTDDPGIADRLRKSCEFFVQSSDKSFGERLLAVINEFHARV